MAKNRQFIVVFNVKEQPTSLLTGKHIIDDVGNALISAPKKSVALAKGVIDKVYRDYKMKYSSEFNVQVLNIIELEDEEEIRNTEGE